MVVLVVVEVAVPVVVEEVVVPVVVDVEVIVWPEGVLVCEDVEVSVLVSLGGFSQAFTPGAGL